jgi:hypothetical protein
MRFWGNRLDIDDQQFLDFRFGGTRLDSQLHAEDRDLLDRIQIGGLEATRRSRDFVA